MTANNATGITLRSLYRDAPDLDVTTLAYSNYGTVLSDDTVEIPALAAPIDFALRGAVRLLRRLGRRGRPASLSTDNDAIRVRGRLTRREAVWRDIRALADVSPVWIPPGLHHTLEAIRPQVVHTLLGNVRMMRIALAISSRYGIPIVPHFMDDWAATIYINGELKGAARRSVEKLMNRIIQRAPELLVIGEAMRSEYSVRYSTRCTVAALGVDESDYRPISNANRSQKSLRELVYVGGLHLGRARQIEDVAEALLGSQWKVVVYSSKSPGIVDRARAEYRETVDEKDVATALQDADALLFVESVDEEIAEYTRLSVSTKVPQYIAAARPVVVIGPADQASVRALLAHAGTSVYVDLRSEWGRRDLCGFLGRDRPPPNLDPDPEPGPVPSAFVRSTMTNSMITAFNRAVQKSNDTAGSVR